MDNSKDKKIQEDKTLSTHVSDKNIDFSTFFEKDKSFVFICKKTEKLTSAVYMISNLFPDTEPMKWTLRKKVSDLLSFIFQYKDVFEGGEKDFSYGAKGQTFEVTSLLEVCFRAGLVSNMNFSLLKQEFFNLVLAIEESKGADKEPANELLSKSFFDVSRPAFSTPSFYSRAPEETLQISSEKTPRQVKDKDELVVKGEVKKSARQNTILTLLRKKKELTIKDISMVIKDCSEKTIQRELISFISAGIVKRTGERRWSTYSLAG